MSIVADNPARSADDLLKSDEAILKRIVNGTAYIRLRLLWNDRGAYRSTNPAEVNTPSPEKVLLLAILPICVRRLLLIAMIGPRHQSRRTESEANESSLRAHLEVFIETSLW